LWQTRRRATERRLPYRITRRYLPPPDTGKRAPPHPQPDRPVLDSVYAGWKAELTWCWLYIEMI